MVTQIQKTNLENSNFFNYVEFNPVQLLYPIPFAILLLFIRSIFYKHVFIPVGLYLGLEDKSRYLPGKCVNGKADQLNSNNNRQENILKFSKKSHENGFSRNVKNKFSSLDKFCESAWKTLFYICSLTLGTTLLWNKPWFWNVDECWTDFGHQSNNNFWYLFLGWSYFWSMFIGQFFDAKRKDFWEMFCHHAITITLMSLGWTWNLNRVGDLILWIHDIGDIPLEIGKMALYLKYQKTAIFLLIILFITWTVTRLIVFPFWIIQSTLNAYHYLNNTLYYTFNGLLIVMLLLHFFWEYFIFKLVHKLVVSGEFKKDSRSDSESSDLENKTD